MPFTLDEILERTQWDFFWVPGDVRVVDRPEIAYLCCPRRVPYLNQVTRLRATASELAGLVEEVTRAHHDVGSRWLVPGTFEVEPLEAALEGAGYAPVHRHHACAIEVDEHRRRFSPGIVVHPVDSVARLHDCHEVSNRAFAMKVSLSEEDCARQLVDCTRVGARVHRFVAYDQETGEPLSSGGVNAYPALGFGFLWAGGTVPEGRGRGAYSAVLAARVARARELGLTHVGLYAVTDTSGPIVLNQGFARHGSMTYWDLPAAGSG